MDVLYIGGLAAFAALAYALIAGCEKLMQFRRADRDAQYRDAQSLTGARS